ncbi:phage antirepressor N-terminal domain-containing protein [Pseudomonas luteola]
MSDLITVPFHGANLILVEHAGQPFVPMRPVVEGMGIDWSAQRKKLASNEKRWGVAFIATPSGTGEQETICIPLRKLPGWLSSLEPSRVKNEAARQKIEMFQYECDDALWQYWNEGRAVNPRAQEKSAANDSAIEFAKLALEHLPNLGANSKQELLSRVSEMAYGQRLIPLPRVEEHLMPAKEVGKKLGISANMIGRLANANGLKIPEYGEFRLDKSAYSSKQVESFFYNGAGLERLRQILSEKSAA